MGEEGSRRLAPLLGWIVAAAVLLVFLVSKYDISIREKASPNKEIGSAVQAPEKALGTGARKTSLPAATGSPRPPAVRELTTEELFRAVSPSVVLIEVFDNEGTSGEREVGLWLPILAQL